ncbi:MAG TPA: hypothetical protein VMR70_11800 [Flavisolibacter sp.]|nr:hypothetical protein [Flavisolibacter sp.]
MDILQALQQVPQNEVDREKLRTELAAYINELITHQFDQLLQLLYRVDVSEQKLKNVLRENSDEDAGLLLADLLLKRQEEKLAARRSFPPANDVSDEERW